MGITVSTTGRSAFADSLGAALNNGTLVFQTSGGVTVATLTFGADAFPSASSGVITANAIASDTNAVGGVIAKCSWKNSGATELINCTVTATGGGGDITLSNLTLGAGDTLAISALTFTSPAS